MRLVDAHGSLLRLRQERSRKLFMGSGCACHHARLRGDDDAVRPLHLLCGRLRAGRHIRAPDLYQMEHGRGRHREIHLDAVRGVHVHHRRLHRIPSLFRLPHIEKRFRISMIVITKSNENEEVKECNERNRRRSIVQGCDARHSGPAALMAQNTAGDYTAGTNALTTVAEEIAKYVPIMVKLCYAIAGVVAIVGAISVYIAMNNEEQDVKKKIMMVVGACIFLIAAAQALPLFFGIGG